MSEVVSQVVSMLMPTFYSNMGGYLVFEKEKVQGKETRKKMRIFAG